jgi:hypothetical protein
MHDVLRNALARELTNDRIARANIERAIRDARPAGPRGAVTAGAGASLGARLRMAGRALHLTAR